MRPLLLILLLATPAMAGPVVLGPAVGCMSYADLPDIVEWTSNAHVLAQSFHSTLPGCQVVLSDEHTRLDVQEGPAFSLVTLHKSSLLGQCGEFQFDIWQDNVPYWLMVDMGDCQSIPLQPHYNQSPPPSGVPEPSTWLLLGSGLLLLRRRM
jgi:PEP-CTERM motif